MTAIVDTSALFALLDGDDTHHVEAVRRWDRALEVELVTHSYVIVESLTLVRASLGRDAVVALADRVLPGIRVEMVDRDVHDAALREYRGMGGGTSFVDGVTIAYAARNAIDTAFAFDRDLETAGLNSLV